MIDVMLIDDDIAICEYLKEVIAWQALDLHVVCETGDSETASELFSMYRPKIVITDINIPIISGLELAKKFVAQDKDVRIIVITGYGDFDNVRDSLTIGAVDLLAKPIDPAEINESLRKAVDELHQLQQRHHTEQAIQELLAENRSLLQEQFITQLFSKPLECEEATIRRQLDLLSLDFHETYFTAVLLRLEPMPADALGGAVFPIAFKKMLDTAFTSNGFQIFSFFGEANELSCLIGFPFENGDDRIEAFLSELLEESHFYFQAGFSACIGSSVTQLRDLHCSAEQARSSAQFWGDAPIVNCRNVWKLSAPNKAYDPKLPAQLMEYAKLFLRNDFHELAVQTCQSLNDEQCREFSVEILSCLATVCFQSGLYPWSAVNYPNTIATIFCAASSADMTRVLLHACDQLIDLLYQQRTRSKNHLISSAKTFILQNLENPELSLEEVSSYVGLSKTYFCQFFHKEEGLSFTSYLNAERLRKAKELLKTTSKKVFEISDTVGYCNVKHFNYVFKHAVGVTPLEYRNGSSK